MKTDCEGYPYPFHLGLKEIQIGLELSVQKYHTQVNDVDDYGVEDQGEDGEETGVIGVDDEVTLPGIGVDDEVTLQGIGADDEVTLQGQA